MISFHSISQPRRRQNGITGKITLRSNNKQEK